MLIPFEICIARNSLQKWSREKKYWNWHHNIHKVINRESTEEENKSEKEKKSVDGAVGILM